MRPLTLLVALITTVGGAALAARSWMAIDRGPGPGGFATVTIDYPKHGDQVDSNGMVIKLQSSQSNAAVHLLLDGKIIGDDGSPLPNQPDDLDEVAPIEFSRSLTVDVPVRRLSPGLHSLEMLAAARGSSRPRQNEGRIQFIAR